ncbi:TPA: hypothetical protein ACH3X1_002695 [Trebouxia sp. C0004]
MRFSNPATPAELLNLIYSKVAAQKSNEMGLLLVKWKGYGPACNSWEPESMIRQRAPDTLSEYWDEVAAEQAVQATQPLTGSDSGLGPW